MKNRAPNPFAPTLLNVGIRYLSRRPWHTALMVIGIMLGVAVVIAIDLANASARRAFDISTDSIAGRATHQITGGPEGLDEEIYTQLRRAGIPFPTTPIVTGFVSSEKLGGLPLQLLGIDPYTEAPFRNYLTPADDTPQNTNIVPFITTPGGVLIAKDLADRYGLSACDGAPTPDCTIPLDISGYTRPAYIVGLLEPADSLSSQALNGIILADIATAQELTGKLGKLSYIDVIIPEGFATTRLEELLPQSAKLQTIAARTGTIEQMTSAFRLNLTALSLLALIVGLFLIYNTMTFSVVKRRPLFGTLRCLGVTRREIFLVVVSEALVIGIIGSLLGAILGILLGQEAVRMVTQTINDLYFVVTVRGIQIPPSSLIKGLLLGVIATVLTAAFPAWEAASVPPRAALSRSGLESKAGKAVTTAAISGVVGILAGLGFLYFPNGSLALSFGGTFAIMLGFAALTPITTTLLMKFASKATARMGILGRMAPRNVTTALSRTSIAIAALMVAVSVTIGIGLMVTSFRGTVVSWLEQTLQGDIYISPPNVSARQSGNLIDPAVLPLLESWAGVARVDAIRFAEIETDYGAIQVGATDNAGLDGERLFITAIGSNAEVWQALDNGAILVSEPLARRLAIPFEGATLKLETPAGPKEFPVAGVYYDYGSTEGVSLISGKVYQEIWGDNSVNAIALRLEDGIDPNQITTALQDRLTPIQQLQIQPNQTLRQEALVVFDRTFAITTSLQGLATIVAFIGVLSALLSLQLEKQRELGILRAIGLTGKQLRKLVLLETGLMGSVAGFLAMPTGFILSLILIYIINRRAFGWTLQMQLSAAPFLQAFAVALLAALLAGIYPAWKMSKMEVAEALRGE